MIPGAVLLALIEEAQPEVRVTSESGRVLVSADDRRLGYLAAKLVAGLNISIRQEFRGNSERLIIDALGLPGEARAVGGARGPAGADAPSTLNVHLMGWDGSQWIPVLGDATGRLVVTS